jgi:hypothetical protein
MFTVRMIQLIEAHAGKLSEELMLRLERSGECAELLQKVPAQELETSAHEIYRHLSDWLLTKTRAEIEEQYVSLGARWAKGGVPFGELLFAFSATKECLWEHLEQDGLFEDPMELIGDLHLLRSIGRFFDLVTHAAAIGYEPAHKRRHQTLLHYACASINSDSAKSA